VLDCGHGKEKSSSQKSEEKEGNEGAHHEKSRAEGKSRSWRKEKAGCEGQGRGAHVGHGCANEGACNANEGGGAQGSSPQDAARRGSERFAGKSGRGDGAAET
jgi:hypothetical protein